MEDVNLWKSKLVLCSYSEKLLNKLLFLNDCIVITKIDIEEIKKAIYYAKKYHGEQKRQSGEPYYSHPIEVAFMVSDYLPKTDVIVTSILHDTIEDTKLTKEMIANVFGELVASQVEDLTRIKIDRKISSAEMVKLLYHQNSKDLLHIKLFDRLHNMQTIGAKSPEKQRKLALESLENFITLAIYLELPEIERELSEICTQITAAIQKDAVSTKIGLDLEKIIDPFSYKLK